MVAFPVDREKLEPVFIRRYHTSSARWIIFQRFLDVEGSRYERVLMVDAGQAFFQDNPFDIIRDPGENVDKVVRSATATHSSTPNLKSNSTRCLIGRVALLPSRSIDLPLLPGVYSP